MRKILSIVLFSSLLILTFYIFSSQYETKTPSGFAVLDTSQIGSYSFEDSFINSNTASSLDANNVIFVDGKIGRAAKFDGTGDFLVLSKGPIEREEDLTISFWIFPARATDEYQIILWEGRDGSNGFGPSDEAHITLDEKVEEIEFFAKGRGENLILKANITKSEWSHIAIVLRDLQTSRSSGRLFVDGELKDYEEIGVPLARNYSHSMRIGVPGEKEHWFNGMLDELRIYNNVYTDNQIRDLYQEGVICTNNKECGNSTSITYCLEGTLCTNLTFPICFSAGKNSYCGMDSNLTCTACEFGCLENLCLPPPEQVKIEKTPEILLEIEKPSFFRRLKCRLFNPFSKEERQICLVKED